MENSLVDALSMVDELINDNNVSRSVRETMRGVMDILNEDSELPVKCDKAIQLLTLNDDPNIDSFTRTRIWSILSMLEAASQES